MTINFLKSTWLVFTILMCCQMTAHSAQSRLALVIGNSSYQGSPLLNPVNDAADMAEQLSLLGFEVILHTDLDRKGMRQAIREFGERLKKVDVGLFYYAGHGIQLNGRNYLVPVKIDLSSADEVEDESIDANAVLRKMETAGNAVNIVILDACRNNPYASAFRSIKQGLARMDGPIGSMIAYSTAPGRVASDGTGRNGLYTGFLLQALQKQNITIEQTFKWVRNQIRQASNDSQIPWESSSLTGEFVFNPGSNIEHPQANNKTVIPPAPKGYLQVITNVENARVVVNNVERGFTDQQRILYISDLEANEVEVTVEMDGFEPRKATVQLTENQWQQLNINLKPQVNQSCLNDKKAFMILKSNLQDAQGNTKSRLNPPSAYAVLNNAFNQQGLVLVNVEIANKNKKRRLLRNLQPGDYAKIAKNTNANILLRGFVNMKEKPINTFSTNMKTIDGDFNLEAIDLVDGRILANQTEHFRTAAMSHSSFIEKKGKIILKKLSNAVMKQVCENKPR